MCSHCRGSFQRQDDPFGYRIICVNCGRVNDEFINMDAFDGDRPAVYMSDVPGVTNTINPHVGKQRTTPRRNGAE